MRVGSSDDPAAIAVTDLLAFVFTSLSSSLRRVSLEDLLQVKCLLFHTNFLSLDIQKVGLAIL